MSQTEHVKEFDDGAIVLIRNPYSAIVAEVFRRFMFEKSGVVMSFNLLKVYQALLEMAYHLLVIQIYLGKNLQAREYELEDCYRGLVSYLNMISISCNVFLPFLAQKLKEFNF